MDMLHHGADVLLLILMLFYCCALDVIKFADDVML